MKFGGTLDLVITGVVAGVFGNGSGSRSVWDIGDGFFEPSLRPNGDAPKN